MRLTRITLKLIVAYIISISKIINLIWNIILIKLISIKKMSILVVSLRNLVIQNRTKILTTKTTNISRRTNKLCWGKLIFKLCIDSMSNIIKRLIAIKLCFEGLQKICIFNSATQIFLIVKRFADRHINITISIR